MITDPETQPPIPSSWRVAPGPAIGTRREEPAVGDRFLLRPSEAPSYARPPLVAPLHTVVDDTADHATRARRWSELARGVLLERNVESARVEEVLVRGACQPHWIKDGHNRRHPYMIPVPENLCDRFVLLALDALLETFGDKSSCAAAAL